MSELNEIKELLVQISNKIDNIEDKIENDVAKNKDVVAVAETLEKITLDEVAVAKEQAKDQAETAYVLNKSITYGTEKRLSEQMNQGFERVNDQFEKVIGSLGHISDIMRSWVYRQSELDKELQEIKRKLNGE